MQLPYLFKSKLDGQEVFKGFAIVTVVGSSSDGVGDGVQILVETKVASPTVVVKAFACVVSNNFFGRKFPCVSLIYPLEHTLYRKKTLSNSDWKAISLFISFVFSKANIWHIR